MAYAMGYFLAPLPGFAASRRPEARTTRKTESRRFFALASEELLFSPRSLQHI
jgi:hypothetical protein